MLLACPAFGEFCGPQAASDAVALASSDRADVVGEMETSGAPDLAMTESACAQGGAPVSRFASIAAPAEEEGPTCGTAARRALSEPAVRFARSEARVRPSLITGYTGLGSEQPEARAARPPLITGYTGLGSEQPEAPARESEDALEAAQAARTRSQRSTGSRRSRSGGSGSNSTLIRKTGLPESFAFFWSRTPESYGSGGEVDPKKRTARLSFTDDSSLSAKRSRSNSLSGQGSDREEGKSMRGLGLGRFSFLFSSHLTDHQEDTRPDAWVGSAGERGITLAARGLTVHPASVNMVHGGRPNTVCTTRFTVFTWLPKSLYGQFQRVANIYFLFICVIVCFDWSPKNWKSKVGPFALVLLWTSCKDLYEDTRRRNDDRVVNAQKVKVLSRGGPDQQRAFVDKQWADVKHGDVLYVPEDEAFPADLLLLHAAGGMEAYISTVMLDGESSLKDRQAPQYCELIDAKVRHHGEGEWIACQACEPERGGIPFPFERLERMLLQFTAMLERANLDIRFAPPTSKLGDVRGSMSSMNAGMDGSDAIPFTELNFLPRGCHLRNTPWVLALALYVGEDTKTRLNSIKGAPSKFSKMQSNLNHCIRGLLLALFGLCVYATSVSFADQGGMAQNTDDNFVIKFFKFCITFYHVVPLSLYVMYEMLKLLLGHRVNVDEQMWDKETEQGAVARTADLMEDLGQVNFIFSDKTGTLTRNEMVFARCHVGGEDLGDFGSDGPGFDKAREILASMEKDAKARDPLLEPVVDFFTSLALCHSVVTSKSRSSSLLGTAYSGASPDDVALVTAAARAGLELTARERKQGGTVTQLTVKGLGMGHSRVFHLLYELPFSSERKRMSVLVRHRGQIWCITKGADSVMEGLLREPMTKKCQQHLMEFSCQGLRTLIVAMKRVDAQEFDRWQAEWLQARTVIDWSKEEATNLVAAKMEQGLKFVGVSAVEDRLQAGAPEAIALMKDMGIRLWVLTGDKTETAVDIARSCKLFGVNTTLSYATGARNEKEAEDKLLRAYTSLDGRKDAGLVLDGQTLLYALKREQCTKVIYDLGLMSRSCICTRLSPQQKLQLVQLVRRHDPQTVTLSIGDGANDVPMIYGAHVGIAVRGKEGAQAVQACDVAISRFCFLVPLLQCHGRRAYRRVALFLCFFLYKNIALIMLDIVFMHQDDFRARIAVPEWLSICYNVFFTSIHILPVLVFDKDLPDSMANNSPSLYWPGPQRKLFNARIFTLWMLVGVYHGVVCWMIPFVLLKPTVDDYDKGETSTFWLTSVSAFTAVILTVCLKLVMVSQNPASRYTVVPTILALVVYVCYAIGLSKTQTGNLFQPCMRSVPDLLLESDSAKLGIVVSPIVALLPDALCYAVSTACWPTELQKVQHKQHAPPDVLRQDPAPTLS